MKYVLLISRLSLLVAAALCALTGAADAGPVSAMPASGWNVTVYYTAVESFHHGTAVAVIGCPVQDCERGHTALGSYPADFVQAVRDEGTGRITTGPHTGGYLNWADDAGYWLDTVPADARGQRLLPWRSAAVDASVAPFGAAVAVLACGVDSASGDQIDPAVCRRLMTSSWLVTDRFTEGLGGAQHVDLYIGEEDRPGFAAASPKVVDVAGAAVRVRPNRRYGRWLAIDRT